MEISYNLNLKHFNSFGLSVNARCCYSVFSENEVKKVLSETDAILVIGGGSNILFTGNEIDQVLLIRIPGKELVEENKNQVIVKIGAGENWHDLVVWSIENNYGGLENLSLIPGCVGAAPIQNIGAYGVELKEVFYGLEAINKQTGKTHFFSNEDCRFGYRYSCFKDENKGKFIITRVMLTLTKHSHRIQLEYGAIKGLLEKKNITNPTIRDISNTVIEIRKSKLPDPSNIGNAGSFFKNPVMAENHFKILKSNFPDIRYYEVDRNYYKIPAAWLIEHCGWKGYRLGDAGIYPKHALILVNYGNAKTSELVQLAKDIQQTVKEKFNITLEPEVNLV